MAKKMPKAIQDFLSKCDYEGGLSPIADYGIDIKPIMKANKRLGHALVWFVNAYDEVNKILAEYDSES